MNFEREAGNTTAAGPTRVRQAAFWLLVMGAVLYEPLQYHLIYLPLIVARLPLWPRFPFWYDAVLVGPHAASLLVAGFLESRPRRLLLAGAAMSVGSSVFRLVFESPAHDAPADWAGRLELVALLIVVQWWLALIPLTMGGGARYILEKAKAQRRGL